MSWFDSLKLIMEDANQKSLHRFKLVTFFGTSKNIATSIMSCYDLSHFIFGVINNRWNLTHDRGCPSQEITGTLETEGWFWFLSWLWLRIMVHYLRHWVYSCLSLFHGFVPFFPRCSYYIAHCSVYEKCLHFTILVIRNDLLYACNHFQEDLNSLPVYFQAKLRTSYTKVNTKQQMSLVDLI